MEVPTAKGRPLRTVRYPYWCDHPHENQIRVQPPSLSAIELNYDSVMVIAYNRLTSEVKVLQS